MDVSLLGATYVHRYLSMLLSFCRTKLLQTADLFNIRGLYFRGCWERIDMVDRRVTGNLRNLTNIWHSIVHICTSIQYNGNKMGQWALLVAFSIHFYNFTTFAWVFMGLSYSWMALWTVKTAKASSQENLSAYGIWCVSVCVHVLGGRGHACCVCMFRTLCSQLYRALANSYMQLKQQPWFYTKHLLLSSFPHLVSRPYCAVSSLAHSGKGLGMGVVVLSSLIWTVLDRRWLVSFAGATVLSVSTDPFQLIHP